jgi:hypothetical protein
MAGKLIVTIKGNTVNVRRGPTDGAGIIGRATVGQQFECIQVLDTPNSKEQWARIEYPNYPDAYVCIRMANGSILAQVSVVPDQENQDFVRGWNACLDAIHQVLVTLRR